MSEDEQIVRILAPAKFHPRSDEEYYAPVKPNEVSRQERSNKCPVFVLALVVILSAVALVFGLIVKPRTPEFQLSSVAVQNLKYGNTPFPSFNMTVAAGVRIKNNNFGKFVFDYTSASVLYEGMVIGEAKSGNGTIKAKKTKGLNFVVDVSSQRLQDAKNLSSDVNSGILKMNLYATLSGKVHLKQVKKRKTADLNCTMTLYLANHTLIQELPCN